MNTICLQLLEACITLYPANADGTPQLSNPIWSGAPAENLRLIERWLKKRTTPTGSLYQIGHPLVPVYELTIDRVWVLQLTASGPLGWNVDYEQYVLDMVWTDQETYQWHRKTLYGVTINERNWDARDVEHGFIEGQSFDGQYVVTSGGAPATQAPVISPTLPYLVYHTDGTQTILLYAYDPDTGLFTAQTDTTNLATITTNPFSIQFAPMEYDDANSYQSGGSYGQNSAWAFGNSNAYQNGGTYGQTSPVVWSSGVILRMATGRPWFPGQGFNPKVPGPSCGRGRGH
jgi:hypothetical protein